MDILNFNTEHFNFISYTLLTEEQSYEVWKGRNHPDIRKWMSNQNVFSFADHTQYVELLRNSADRIYWAVLKDNVVIGSLSLNPYSLLNKEGEMGKFLFPAYMGCGLGLLMTKEFLQFMLSNKLVNRIYAKTKIDNVRNQNLNLKLGFKIYAKDSEYVYMEIGNEYVE